MAGFPRFHRPQYRQVVQFSRQPRQQAERQFHRTTFYRAKIKIGWSPAAFFEVESVDLTGSSVEKQENTIFGRAAQLGFRVGAHILRPNHGRKVETRNADRADLQETPTRKTRNSGWYHRNS